MKSSNDDVIILKQLKYFIKIWFCFAPFLNGRTDDMCEYSDHYRPWLWVGLVDQNVVFAKKEQ